MYTANFAYIPSCGVLKSNFRTTCSLDLKSNKTVDFCPHKILKSFGYDLTYINLLQVQRVTQLPGVIFSFGFCLEPSGFHRELLNS